METVLHSFGSSADDGECPTSRASAGQRRQFLRDDLGRRDEQRTAPCFGSVPAAATRIFTRLAATPTMGPVRCRAGAGQRRQFLRDDLIRRDDNDCGTVFRISPGGSYTNLYSFAGSPNDGAIPAAGLVQGSDGNFYGTTADGGTSALRHRVSDQSQRQLHESLLFGSYPTMGTIHLPGWCRAATAISTGRPLPAGRHDYGTVFRISPSGTYTSLYSFASGQRWGLSRSRAGAGQRWQFLRDNQDRRDERRTAPCFGSVPAAATRIFTHLSATHRWGRPNAGLVQGSDGNFYGTTYGRAGRTTPTAPCFGSVPAAATRIFTPLPVAHRWSKSRAGLVQGSDGNFYGTTGYGGTNSIGTVFKLADFR